MATRLRSARFGVRIPAGAIKLSTLQNVQVGSGAHPASYSMSNDASFPGLKRGGSETDYSPLYPVPRLKMSWSLPLFPLHAFMAYIGTISHFTFLCLSICLHKPGNRRVNCLCRHPLWQYYQSVRFSHLKTQMLYTRVGYKVVATLL